MIEISEIFLAVQGEGPNLGRPSLFVRTHRCNLSCSWCDTPYTWNKDDPGFQDFTQYDSPARLAEAMQSVSQSTPYPPQAVVLTGGEPLIWQREMADALLLYRSEYPVPVEVETAGTLTPSPDMLRMCSFNISHKLPSAGNDVALESLWNADVVQKICKVGGWPLSNVCFKPVLGPQDFQHLERYLQWLESVGRDLGLPWDQLRQRIYLMPQASTVTELEAIQKHIITLAANYGTRVTTRLQVLAFGNQRGT